MKYRSRAMGQGACLQGMSRTISMQGFTLAAITVKYRSRAPGQGACLKGMSRTISMQVFTPAAITE